MNDRTPADEHGGAADEHGLPLGAKIAAVVAAVVLVLLLLTSVDLSGGDDAPSTSRTFTGFDTTTTTLAPATTAR